MIWSDHLIFINCSYSHVASAQQQHCKVSPLWFSSPANHIPESLTYYWPTDRGRRPEQKPQDCEQTFTPLDHGGEGGCCTAITTSPVTLYSLLLHWGPSVSAAAANAATFILSLLWFSWPQETVMSSTLVQIQSTSPPSAHRLLPAQSEWVCVGVLGYTRTRVTWGGSGMSLWMSNKIPSPYLFQCRNTFLCNFAAKTLCFLQFTVGCLPPGEWCLSERWLGVASMEPLLACNNPLNPLTQSSCLILEIIILIMSCLKVTYHGEKSPLSIRWTVDPAKIQDFNPDI